MSCERFLYTCSSLSSEGHLALSHYNNTCIVVGTNPQLSENTTFFLFSFWKLQRNDPISSFFNNLKFHFFTTMTPFPSPPHIIIITWSRYHIEQKLDKMSPRKSTSIKPNLITVKNGYTKRELREHITTASLTPED